MVLDGTMDVMEELRVVSEAHMGKRAWECMNWALCHRQLKVQKLQRLIALENRGERRIWAVTLQMEISQGTEVVI